MPNSQTEEISFFDFITLIGGVLFFLYVVVLLVKNLPTAIHWTLGAIIITLFFVVSVTFLAHLLRRFTR